MLLNSAPPALPQVECSGTRRELPEQGCQGRRCGVYELLQWLRQGHVPPSVEDHLPTLPQEEPKRTLYTARQGFWWFVQTPAALSASVRVRLTLLRATVKAGRTVYEMVQGFAHLLGFNLEKR